MSSCWRSPSWLDFFANPQESVVQCEHYGEVFMVRKQWDRDDVDS